MSSKGGFGGCIEDEMMDDYYFGTSHDYYTEQIIVDPETGPTLRQLAYLEYRRACEAYEAAWVGVPWYTRTEEPPQWEDFWQD